MAGSQQRHILNPVSLSFMLMKVPFGERFFLTMLTLLAVSALVAQQKPDPDRPADNMEEYQARYAERIRQTHLAGVYIPAHLDEAVRELEKRTPAASLESYRNAPEDIIVPKLFFGLGRWIIHNWGFYEGSRLSHWFRQQGVYHPDDMARVVMISYHRYLNRKPIELEAQVAVIQERIRKEEEERRKQAKVLHEERRPADADKERR